MFRGGRPRDPIWEHFTLVEDGKKSTAKCKHCNKEQSAKVYRMKDHYKKCSQTADSVAATTSPVSSDAGMKRCAEQDSPDSPLQKKSRQEDMSSFIFKTGTAVRGSLDELMARMFYACNIPFSVVEHPTFVELVQALRPGYKPPTRKALAGPLLDTVQEKIQNEMKQELQGKVVTLVEDGWSNIHNDPVVATSIAVDGKAYFLDAHDTGSMQKTAENCASLCQESISSAEVKYGCKVKNVVTDNAKNMEKMRDKLKAQDPDLNVYGCLAHWLNLLGQDITPAGIMKHVTEVQKYFRNHHRPSAWLKDCAGSVKPQLPGDTRWKSQLICLESFLTNRPHYTQIVQDHEADFDATLVRKVMDYNLFRQARDLADQLKPVAVAIDKAQSDTTGLADAYKVFMDLQDEPLLQPHKDRIQHRFRQAIKPCHMVAYKLHPGYRGRGLSAKQEESVAEWLIEKDPSYVEAVIAFDAEAAPFPAFFFKTTGMAPLTWWKGLQKYNFPEGFVDTMIQLHAACASSASIERVFSTFGLVHSKLRNRLGVAKAAKLVLCYRMLRGHTDLDY